MHCHTSSVVRALVVAFILGVSSSSFAHEPDANGQHDPHGDHGISHRSQSLVLPRIEGEAKPWTKKPVLNDPSRFHFAVMTDRTGGHRRGIWMQAVRNLNLLRPEFVVSVGDLIEGYTDDRQRAENEWKEFLGFVDQLDMRFFFVAGNHDVTNPMLHEMWRKKFGREYYSFDYQGVHFLCLLSEDPSASIGKKQLAWAQQDLKEHADARWTFVFLHKPLWAYAEREIAAGNADPTNWKKVEAALGSRPHTVFAGHVHHYVQFERNGSEYYQLATTGGGSQLRGQAYGEFDHVVWVTMEESGPRIANILLDGVLAADAVTEQSIQRFREFLDETRFVVKPILIQEGGELQTAAIEIEVTNEFDDLIHVDAQVLGLPLEGLSMESSSIKLEVPPHDTKKLTCRFRMDHPLDYEMFRSVVVNGKIRSQGEGQLTAELTVPVTIDRRHSCPQVTIDVDGDLGDWDVEEERFMDNSTTYGARQQWQGLEDAGMRFRVGYDDESLLFSGVVTDDKVIPDRDVIYIGIDARSMEERLQEPRLGERSYTVQLSPNVKEPSQSKVRVYPRRGRLAKQPQTRVAVTPTNEGYKFELAVAKSLIERVQGKEWSDFQLNVVLRDVDEADEKYAFVSWRPTPDARNLNTNYAFFFREGAVNPKPSATDGVRQSFASPPEELSLSEAQRFDAPEAVQAVAVDADHFYAISNAQIGKYERASGKRVGGWSATPEIPLKHLNSGIIIDGMLYCAHSNYPSEPETSSIELWNPKTLTHLASQSFGHYEGSLTWFDRHGGYWWAVFAHYTREGKSKDNRWTTLVKFDDQWRRLSGWTFPQTVLNRFGRNSSSGGFWGDDGLLYCTGHDHGEIYRLAIPKSGSTLRHVDTLAAPITGQGIARFGKSIFGISRPKRQVIELAIEPSLESAQ